VSELSDYAAELLADGEWHDYHVVVSRVAARVHPGRAYRRAESQRRTAGAKYHGGRDNVPARSRGEDLDHQIRIGSRHIAKQLLNGNRFEVAPHGAVRTGEQKFVRLRRL
jgi:hypothetical protein